MTWEHSIHRETRYDPKDWCSDCSFVDDMKDGEERYVGDDDFYRLGNEWFIDKDRFSSPYKRGVHNTLIKRQGDIILVREDVIKDDRRNRTDAELNNGVSVLWRPYTQDEKVDILWKERTQK